MRKIIILFVAIGLCSGIFNSCNKEEKRITNIWKMTSYIDNWGNTSTVTYNAILDVKDDNLYVNESSLPIGNSGNWSLSSDNKSISFVSVSGSTHTFPFITLEKKKMTLGATDGVNIAEYYFEQK